MLSDRLFWFCRSRIGIILRELEWCQLPIGVCCRLNYFFVDLFWFFSLWDLFSLFSDFVLGGNTFSSPNIKVCAV